MTPVAVPFHISIVRVLDSLKVENAANLETLNILALLTVMTIVPREHRIAVGAALSRKHKAVSEGPKFRRAEEVLANVSHAVTTLVERDDQDEIIEKSDMN